MKWDSERLGIKIALYNIKETINSMILSQKGIKLC